MKSEKKLGLSSRYTKYSFIMNTVFSVERIQAHWWTFGNFLWFSQSFFWLQLMLNKISLIRSTILVVSFHNNVLMNNIHTNNSFLRFIYRKTLQLHFFAAYFWTNKYSTGKHVKDLFQIQLIYEEHIRYMIILSKYLQISIKETCI